MQIRSFAYYPMRRLASRRAGLAAAFVWAMAEGLWWPIVPDVLVFSAALAAPRRWWRLALAASAGSVIGGIVAYGIARSTSGAFPINSLPLVGGAMIDTAAGWLGADGAAALLRQPLSGIPFKVFAYLAGDAEMGIGGFAAFSAVARSLRIFAFAGLAAGLGAAGKESGWSRAYDAFIGILLVIFALGLIRVVNSF